MSGVDYEMGPATTYLLLPDLLFDGGGAMLPLGELLEELPLAPDGLLDIPPVLEPVPALPLVLPDGGFVAPDWLGLLLHALNDIAKVITVAVNNNLFVNMPVLLAWSIEKGARAARRGKAPFPLETVRAGNVFQRATKRCKRCTVVDAAMRQSRKYAASCPDIAVQERHGTRAASSDASATMYPEGVPRTVVRSMCRRCVSSKSPRAWCRVQRLSHTRMSFWCH